MSFILLFISFFAFHMKLKWRLKTLFKDIFYSRICNKYGFEYFSNKGIDLEKLKETKIPFHWDDYSSSDLLVKRVGDIRLNITLAKWLFIVYRKDVCLRKDTLIINLELPKKSLFGHTILTRNVNSIYETLIKQKNNFSQISFTHSKFNKYFDLFTTDNFEAHYVFDPIMLEKIVDIHEAVDGVELYASFYDDQIVIIVPLARPMLDVEVDDNIDYAAKLESLDLELKRVLEFVDIVKALTLKQKASI